MYQSALVEKQSATSLPPPPPTRTPSPSLLFAHTHKFSLSTLILRCSAKPDEKTQASLCHGGSISPELLGDAS